jgi:hypothetical protein
VIRSVTSSIIIRAFPYTLPGYLIGSLIGLSYCIELVRFYLLELIRKNQQLITNALRSLPSLSTNVSVLKRPVTTTRTTFTDFLRLAPIAIFTSAKMLEPPGF